MKKLKQEKAITLVAMVITIILLLILAGISIQAITNTGLFEAAGQAKKEAKRAQVVEWLNLKLIEEQTYNPIGTSEQIIKATKLRVDNNKSELEKIGKTVIVEETKTEEGEQVDIYFYVQVDKDVFKVEIKGSQFIGEAGKFPPIIKLESVTSTTNSITVTVSTKRNEGGNIEYYIKSEDEEKYTLKETTTDENYTYTGLEQNKNYSIKIVAIAENRQTAEVTKDVLLGSVTNLTDANIIFTYEPDSWTNGSVKVTAALKDMTSSYTLKITDSNPVGASKQTALGWTNASTGITVSTNKTVYAVLIDNEGQIGAAASGSVEKIDTVAPTIGSATGTTATGNTGTITVSSVADTGGSGLKGYYISTSSTTPTATSVTWTSNTASSFTKTVSSNGTYYVWVIDNAGNVSSSKSCSVSGIVSKASITTYSGITIVAGNTGTPTLTYTGSPKSITYSSSNTGVATINSSTGVVTGVSEGTATMTVTLTNYDGTTVSKTCIVTVNYTSLASKVTVGDYVAYDATSNYSYTSVTGTGPSHGSGYSSSQTFTTNSDIKWRVLSANTSTGEVVLISETPIKTDAGNAFIMSSAIGYLYAEEELNRICAIYGHGTGANTSKTFTCQNGDTVEGLRTVTLTGSGARSINVDDINAITGYTPTTGSSYTKSIYYPTKTTSTGYSGPANRTDTNTDYYYKGSSYLTSTEEPYKMLFRDTSDSSNIFYLLASRCVTSFSSDSWFNVRCVGSGGVHYFILGYGFGGRFGDESFGHGVRPIVYLKSTIQTSGKDSSGAWTIIDK